MNTTCRLLTGLLGLCFLAACATKPPEPVKYSVNGFTISLFEKEDKDKWGVVQQAPERVMLGKPGDFTGETLSILMTAHKVAGQSREDLRRFARDNERVGLDTKRYRILRQDISPHEAAGLACVLSRLEVEDRGAAGATGPVTGMVSESMTVTCPDPARPMAAVSVSYVHQSYPEDKGRLMDKGMPILQTLEHTAKP